MLSEIIAALLRLGGVSTLQNIYDEVYNNDPTILDRFRSWETFTATIRRTIEDNSSDSLNYKGNDIFFRVKRGTWGLRNLSKNK